jgi:hypothetical protein
MLKLNHNKKRNVGLIFEFFARYIGRAIVENKDSEIKKAKSILNKHFNKGTDLYKEFHLFKALFETRLQNKESALKLIERVKSQVKLQSQTRLDLEKTGLIHEINQNLNSDSFFNQNIKDYKTYATIQILLNEWRNKDLNESHRISSTAELEDQILSHLTQVSAKPTSFSNIQEMKTEEIDGLVVNIMTDKLNQKFSDMLNEEQKEIIRLYTFIDDDETSRGSLVQRLQGIKEDFSVLCKTVSTISEGSQALNSNAKTKLFEVKNLLEQDFSNFAELNDDTITFYLGLSNLKAEIRNKNE